MLRIIQSQGVQRAKSYYSTTDYYLDGEQELPGRWCGKGADLLGLKGEIDRHDWEALCDNLDPRSSQRLTQRNDADRTVGYDFNFHVPKSLSLLYGMTRDDRLLDAFRDAVDGTMQDVEVEMRTRVRKSGKNVDRLTGNMTWGEFVHFTSRPVDGVPDPHLHAHCFVFNVTNDKEEARWKAGQFRELKRDAPYFEAVFHSRLASRLTDLGLPIDRKKQGWELGGVTSELIQKFSRRTALIEEKAQELGIENAEAKSELGARTRESKQKNLTLPQLKEIWRSRMTDEEIARLESLEQRVGSDAEPQDGTASQRAIEYAIQHEFERKSVTPERKVLATALKRSVGEATVEQVLEQARRSELITGDRQGRRMATTRDVLAEEQQVIEFARKGRGTCVPYVRKLEEFRRDWLNDDQKRAVRHIVESRDKVLVVRGSAGVGKTTLLKEAVEQIEETGIKVFAFAPSADASRGVLASEGFQAETVARLLVDEQLQQQAAGQMLLIDEAGLLGMRTMRQVFELAERQNCRILLSGDWRQHGAVERGAALRVLEEEAGIVPAQVKEIQRQKGTYKEAIKALSEGRVQEGFQRLDDLGWVKEIADREERDRQLTAEYLTATERGKSVLIVSPTHAEGERITANLRQALQRKGKVAQEERTFDVFISTNLTEAERGDLLNYQSGDVLQFNQNAKGFGRGDRCRVEGGKTIPVDQASRFQVYRSRPLKLAVGDRIRITRNGVTIDGKHKLNNGAIYGVKGFDSEGNIQLENGWAVGKNFSHWTYGYVTTSHSSQGKTVDHVLVAQSSESFPASSQEQFYVSTSRAKQKVLVFTDDKHMLQESISQSDDRLSATEFLNAAVQQHVIQRQNQEREILEREQRELMATRTREERDHVR